MSRSDDTRPRWVRLTDQPMVTVEPRHDHRDGRCTLPPEVTAASADPMTTTGCRWVATPAFAAVRTDGGAPEWNRVRRADRRRARHEERRRLRGLDVGD